MADAAERSFDDFAALSPNERAKIMQSGVVRNWDDLPADQQARITARSAELRQRRADA